MNKSTMNLQGSWELESASPENDLGERVQMRFTPDMRLIYGALEGGKWQIMLLTYRVDGDSILTNQPSAPCEEKTGFKVTADGKLHLAFAGSDCVFNRVPDLAFRLPVSIA